MKKHLFGVFALSIGLFLVSCGDSATDAKGEAIEISDEMAAFIKDFNGSYEVVEKSLAEYGANDEIIEHDMGMYDLKDPKVTARKGDCYTLVCKSGQVENTYEICWENKKIVSITGG